MSTSRISTTELSSYYILSPGGQAVVRTYDQLTSELRRSLSEEHASLFAEPVMGEQTERVNWYGPRGTATRLVDLPDEERVAAEAKLHALHEDISSHAEKLNASDNRDQKRLGSYLEHAIKIPSPDHVYVINGQPVLINWGMTPSGKEADIQVLKLLAKEYPERRRRVLGEEEPPPEPVPMEAEPSSSPVVEKRSGWPAAVLAGVFVAILITIGWQLLSHCGLALPTFVTGGKQVMLFDYCDDSLVAHNALKDLIKNLEEDAKEKFSGKASKQEAVPQKPTKPKKAYIPEPKIPHHLVVHNKVEPNVGKICINIICQSAKIVIKKRNEKGEYVNEKGGCRTIDPSEVPIDRKLLKDGICHVVSWHKSLTVSGKTAFRSEVDLLVDGKKVVSWPYERKTPNQDVDRLLKRKGKLYYHYISSFQFPYPVKDTKAEE